MYNLRDFLMIGMRDAVGKMADYQVIFDAAGWQKQGVLMDDDMAELYALIKAKNTPPEEPVVEEDEVIV